MKGSALLHVLNPATEELVATVESATREDVDTAVVRATGAQRAWAAVAPADRARLLRRFAATVDQHLEELAELEVREAGHLIGNARWEAGNVRDLLEYAAGGVERLTGRQIPVAGGLDVTLLEPLGVVGVIAPWNFPMPIAAWGTAPALAAGNAVLLKPAETTPLTALRLAELALEAGLPEGLFQVLPGEGPVAGDALVEHPGVAKIVFTGSARVGKQVMAKCADHVKRVTLELGGKSPNIVFADADVEAAALATPMSFLDNSGQDCCARTRILVQRSVYERYLELLAPAIESVVVGDPSDEKTQMGPLISKSQLARVRSYVPAGASAIRGASPEGRASGSRPPSSPTPRPTRPPPSTRSSARSPSSSPSRTRRTPCASPTPPSTASPVRSGPATSAAPCGCPGPSAPATCPSTRMPACAIRPRSADTSSPGSAVNSAPTPSPRSPRPRTSSSARRPEHLMSEDIICRRLVGRTAVITGAGSGIGLATARRLASEGAHVVCGDIDESAGKKAAEDVGGTFVQVDVTDAEQVEALFKTAYDTYGSVDIAFNNAGISPPDDDSILDTGLEAWKRVQEVNLTSVYLCCKAALPYMRRQGRGSIINTASFVARMGAATSQISYTASKGGVLAMSRELGVQFAREGIRVNALCPGPVNTPLLQELFAKDPERAARRLVHIPVGRFAEATEIAAAVAFLASDDAAFVNATDFLVDGGISGAYVTPV